VVRLAVNGQLDRASFYRLYRSRRTLPWYVNALTEKACAAGHFALDDRAVEAVIRNGRAHLGRAVKAKIAAQRGS